MTGAVFATKWDFLFAQVLIGVDRTTGVFSGSEPVPGQQLVAVWTSTAIAEDALHVEAWELRPIAVRELLRLLPSGIGVVVDPERPSGMTATVAYVANLKRYVAAFPAGSEIHLAPWVSMPDGVRAALVQAVDGRVQELRAFTYRVDDSPLLGCLAHVVLAGVDPADVTSAVESALTAATDLGVIGLPRVDVLALDDVPDEVRSALGEGHVLHRRRRRRFLR